MNYLRTLLVWTLAVGVAHADDVTLKSGAVHKDLTLVKESDKGLEFLTLDGKKLSFSKDSVIRHEKKPTARDEFKTKLAAVDKKDAGALTELGKWAKEAGLSKEARQCGQDAVKIAPDHADARLLLGQRKVGDKWLSEADAKRSEDAAKEADYKARGFKKVGDTWYSPADHARVTAGFVPHENTWVKKEIKEKIDKEGWVFAEGEWVSPADKEKIDAGFRMHEGKWVAIAELDPLFTSLDKPWVHRSEHFEVRSNLSHAKGRVYVDIAEHTYSLVTKLLGSEPDLLGKRGPIVLIVGAKMADYKKLGQAAKTDFDAVRSSSFGGFYESAYGDGRGAACTYYLEIRPHDTYFPAHAVTHAIIDRFAKTQGLNAPLLDAVAGYGAGGYKGTYYPRDQFYWLFSAGKQNLLPAASELLNRVQIKNEASMAHAGLLLHYASLKNEAAFKSFWPKFLASKAGPKEFLVEVLGQDGKLDTAALDKDFEAFLKDYRAKWRPWDKK